MKKLAIVVLCLALLVPTLAFAGPPVCLDWTYGPDGTLVQVYVAHDSGGPFKNDATVAYLKVWTPATKDKPASLQIQSFQSHALASAGKEFFRGGLAGLLQAGGMIGMGLAMGPTRNEFNQNNLQNANPSASANPILTSTDFNNLFNSVNLRNSFAPSYKPGHCGR